VDKVPVGTRKGGRLLQPPTPIIRAGNWPTLEIKKTTLEDLSAADAGDEYEEEAAPAVNTGAPNTAWDDDFGAENGYADMGAGNDDYDAGDDMGWGDDEGLDDLGDFGEDTNVAPVDEMAGLHEISDESGFQMPPAGRPPAGCWVANSSHAADHMAAGGASSAMQLLHRQIAASDFATLKGPMLGCYLGSSVSLPGKMTSVGSKLIFL
jgi:coatomer protein complex subunit alpha (xenin)